jgi:Glycosyltransferase family 87
VTLRREVPTSPSPFLAASVELGGFVRAANEIWRFAWLGLLPIGWCALVMYGESRLGLLGFDFKGTIWQPARDILAGHSPYPAPVVSELNTGNPCVYPPLALLATLPFGLLPFSLAYASWMVASVAAVFATLRILGVRDWRCYTLALGACPIVNGFLLGNIVIMLVPLAALAWRYRNNMRWSGLAVGLGIALKLVLWPLLIWFLATRRWRAALVAVSAAAVMTLAAWAPLGFAGLHDYPRLVSVNNDIYAPHSWSLLSGLVGLGLSTSVAGTLSSLVGLVLLLSVFFFVRQQDGERRAFCIAIVASMAVLPIVWPASLALLLVPVAMYAPRADRNWFLFLALWLGGLLPHAFAKVGPPPDGVPEIVWKMQHSAPPTAQIAGFVAVTAVLTAALLRRSRPA